MTLTQARIVAFFTGRKVITTAEATLRSASTSPEMLAHFAGIAAMTPAQSWIESREAYRNAHDRAIVASTARHAAV